MDIIVACDVLTSDFERNPLTRTQPIFQDRSLAASKDPRISNEFGILSVLWCL